jgi:hypothetical protein
MPPVERAPEEGGPRDRTVDDILKLVSFKTRLGRSGEFENGVISSWLARCSIASLVAPVASSRCCRTVTLSSEEGGPRDRTVDDILKLVSFKTRLGRSGEFDDYTAGGKTWRIG